LKGILTEVAWWGEVEWRMDGRQMEVESAQHGQKRHAEDNLENEQRLAKRFNALNLGTFIFSISCW